MTAQALLDEINDTTGGAWQLDARLARGRLHGAWRIRDGASVAVLKGHDASSHSDLRASTQPHTSEHHHLDPYVRDHVFTAHPLQRQLASVGGDLARLLTASIDLARPYEHAVLVDTEMVHSDLNIANVLVRDGQLVAVVDIDGTGRGCAVYDLLSPAVSGVSWNSDPRAVDRLVRHALDTYGPGPVAIAIACHLIETTTWYQRSDPDHIEQRARRHLSWLHQLHRRLMTRRAPPLATPHRKRASTRWYAPRTAHTAHLDAATKRADRLLPLGRLARAPVTGSDVRRLPAVPWSTHYVRVGISFGTPHRPFCGVRCWCRNAELAGGCIRAWGRTSDRTTR